MTARIAVILGSPRSGTTFLMHAMAASRGVEAIAGRVFPSQIPAIVAALDDPVLHQALAFSLRHSLRVHVRWVEQSRIESIARFLRGEEGLAGLINGVMGKTKVETLLFKEPFLAFAPAWLHDALPDARFVHIRRDGRDVADSLLRTYRVLNDEHLRTPDSNEVTIGRKVGEIYVPWWVPESRTSDFVTSSAFGRAAYMWSELTRRTREHTLNPTVAAGGRWIEVSYEELIRDPMNVARGIMGHCGLPMGPAVARRLAGARVTSIGTYRRRDPKEIADAERLAGPMLRELGYLT